jgi:hypothetical protein
MTAAEELAGVVVRRLDVRPVVSAVGGFISVDELEEARHHPDAAAVVRWVKRRDAAALRRGKSTTTVVHWHNVPDGFAPPAP